MSFLAIEIFLVAVLQTLDTLNHSTSVLAADGADWRSLVMFAGMRAPLLASKFASISVLLATLLTLAGLSRWSEITIMRGAGLSARQIIAPLVVACIPVVIAHFLFHEIVTVRTQKQLAFWWDSEFSLPMRPPREGGADIWFSEGSHTIHVETVRNAGATFVLENITDFKRGPDGRLTVAMKADRGMYNGEDWILFNVRRFDAASLTVNSAPSERWDINLNTERLFALAVKPSHIGTFAMAREIRSLWRENTDATALETEFFGRFVGPAASFLMPLLGVMAGFGILSRSALIWRVLFGLTIGFSYFIVQNFMAAMGEFGLVAPFLAAVTPLCLYFVLGSFLLLEIDR